MPVTIGGSGPITGVTSINTTVSDTELGYLDGVTSALQTQINTAGGLVKITDSTFSAVSSVSVNNCFSSTYQNYRILWFGNASTDVSIQLRLRASGTDASGSNYDWQQIEIYGTTIQAGRSSGNTVAVAGYASADSDNAFSIDVFRPFDAARTTFLSYFYWSSGTARIHLAGSRHSLSTSYDGFTLIPSTGTLTGTIRVYGYRN